jgi:hypothetical protein
MNRNTLFVGGLVAMGFDPSGRFLLTVSHAGRGVFETGTWNRVARDKAVVYPKDGKIEGIGPLAGMSLAVDERNEKKEQIKMRSPDGRYDLLGESDGITVTQHGV